MSQNNELKNNIQEQTSETQQTTPPTYTKNQVREIYNEVQKSGYLAAIKNIRSNLNDYLDNLIIAAQMNNNNK